MKKILIDDMIDLLEKLEEIENGKLKIAKLDYVISNLLTEKISGGELTVYLIPNNTGTVLMLFPSPASELFPYISTPNPFIISYISVAHINRLLLYTKQIYFLLEE